MKRILILYTSGTGNTEEIACLLEQHIDKASFEVTMKNFEMDELDVQQLKEKEELLKQEHKEQRVDEK